MPVATAAQVPGGRFQLEVAARDAGNTICVLDVHTGQLWSQQAAFPRKWSDLGSPVIKTME